SGDYTIAPQLENPAYFNVFPASASISFPSVDNSTQIRDFCLSANGIHPDLEVVLIPVGAARPGFDSQYRIVYKNKGNQTLSGSVNVVFDDAKTDFVSSIPTVNNQSLNSLIWNFTNLHPFESREINFTLNINSPIETPSVNAGDVLEFTTSINFAAGDDTPNDNISQLHQIVVNALDPNAKTCIEGNVVSSQLIGDYLHYNIEFENLGTADAINVVVKDEIDPELFDINSLQVLYSSHEMRASIRGNTVEFAFENINLAAASGNPPVGGHGNVLFKIKTLPGLSIGDEVRNKANIYFDYNAAVETNMARTTFQMLSNPQFQIDQSVVIYPNPAIALVNISSKSTIKTLELYDIQGRLLEVETMQSQATTLDLTGKEKGVYFVKVITEKGIKIEK
ncbi:MAG: T9SS type A sorting domain-containing protein, partial [Flavobacterium sp.]